jgi:hypothetical protein
LTSAGLLGDSGIRDESIAWHPPIGTVYGVRRRISKLR